MRNFLFLLFIYLLPLGLKGQTNDRIPNIIFTLTDLEKVHEISTVNSSSLREGLMLEILGAPNLSSCKIVLNNIEFPCSNFKEGNKSLMKLQDQKLEYADQEFVLPMLISLDYDNINRVRAIVGSDGIELIQGTQKQAVSTERIKWDVPEVKQSLWQDALRLNEALAGENVDLLEKVLTNYIGGTKDSSYLHLYDTIEKSNNVFLLSILPKLDKKTLSSAEEKQDKSTVDPQSANSTSNSQILSPTVIITAIVDVINQRLIDELNIAFLDSLRSTLEGNQELTSFLPTTTQHIVSVGQEGIFDYKAFLPGLRQQLFEDLKALPGNSSNYIRSKGKKLGDKNLSQKDIYIPSLVVLEVVDGLQNQQSPEQIISELGKDSFAFKNPESVNLVNWIRLMSSISNNLRTENGAGGWIDKGTLEEFTKDPKAIYAFAGLLLAQEKTLLDKVKLKTSNGNTSLSDYLIKDAGAELINLIYQTMALIKEKDLRSIKTNDKNKSEQKLTYDDYYLFLDAFLSFISEIAVFEENQVDLQKLISINSALKKAINNVNNKQYVSATTHLISILTIVGITPNTALKQELFRYVSFGQAIVDAEDKEALVAALQEAADPVGSYRLKRHHPYTISISSLPGLNVGHEEYLEGVNNHTAFNNFGFTAPLGLAFSFPVGKVVIEKDKIQPAPSITLFAPILDVGVVSQFRLSDREAELPELAWENFIAPGFFVEYGFAKSPISLFAGTQYGPEARSIDPEDMSLETSRRLWRFNVGLSADLHLWSIYNRPLKR